MPFYLDYLRIKVIFAVKLNNMSKGRIIDETTLLSTMNNHGEGEKGVYAGDGYGLLWDSGNVTVSQWNKLDNPYRTSGYWMSITVSGVTGFSYNLQEAYLPVGFAVIMKPGVIVNPLNGIHDYDLRVLNLDEDFGSLFTMQEEYVFVELTSQMLDFANDYLDIIRRLHEAHADSKEIVYDLAASLFKLAISHNQVVHIQKSTISRKQEVFENFMRLLNANGLHEHRIAWYAEKLAMTPNYLNSLIKEISGMTIVDWVNQLLVTESKAILTHSDMSVRGIAEYLNFPNDAYFCRYFKKHTGMRPSEYRKR